MNKEQAKQELYNLAFPKFDTIPEKLNLVDVLSIVEQIDEPQAEEQLGVLLVDMPKPSYRKYYYLYKDGQGIINISTSNDHKEFFGENSIIKVTEAEAKEKYPNFRWVSLEELEKEVED